MFIMVQERYIKPGKLEELKTLQRALRQAVLKNSGFITGEALIDVNDPNHQIVTATWRTLAAWKDWQQDREHQDIAQRMQSLLVGPPKTTMCTAFAIERSKALD